MSSFRVPFLKLCNIRLYYREKYQLAAAGTCSGVSKRVPVQTDHAGDAAAGMLDLNVMQTTGEWQRAR